MALITSKKQIYEISTPFRQYLYKHGQNSDFSLQYQDLTRYVSAVPLYDSLGEDTLWETVYYSQEEMESIHENLKRMYADLKSSGDISVIKHLYIDRVDVCVYGNTRPFRIRVVNRINDNFDYFYVKHADASRLYGLELENLLSPNLINYLVSGNTLIEEHIAGIPGDLFIKEQLNSPSINKIRLAKEFIKFNERCFVRLLGDMHSSNFVVVVTPDFEEVHYRIRAIDFDQQSYEGRRSIYMPQYFKQNNALIEVGIGNMTPETMVQYQKEERALIATRIRSSHRKIRDLLAAMLNDNIALPDNTNKLKNELADFYKNNRFLRCNNM
ncbi:hypothetical protein, partial [Xanthovirga aplysinae]|uniref:hypothetical protein n=1 Tax=Xanthovirga aplysinae TaxID=2529853 RepID=UPI0012BBF701